MFDAFLLLSFAATTELIVHCVPLKHLYARRAIGAASIYAITLVTILLVMRYGEGLCVLAIFSAYRIFNMSRVIRNRMQADYLRRVTLRSSLLLVILSYFVFAAWITLDMLHIPYQRTETFLIGVLLLASLSSFVSVTRHMKKMWRISDMPAVHDMDLPTVTVAIPARNETQDLEECLHSVLESLYPKMEVLVLDDCSESQRTAEIIRNFAHDGVRFIRGDEPKPGWLAKNHAYERLASEANGEIIVFLGVDVRLEPHAIRRLVQYMQTNKKSMLSVMPKNNARDILPMIQPMRYFWELALPRRAANRPPVLSTCWLITKSALMKSGGFKSVPHSIIPERHFAGQLVKNDGYGFLASGDSYRVTSVKSVREQRATAVRTAYPMLHNRPENVALMSVAYVLWILIPLAVAVQYYHRYIGLNVFLVALAAVIVNLGTYGIIIRLSYGWKGLRYVPALPFAALTYIALLNYSMCKYEFSKVIWKDRNVSFPVMHVVPKLPDF